MLIEMEGSYLVLHCEDCPYTWRVNLEYKEAVTELGVRAFSRHRLFKHLDEIDIVTGLRV